MTKSFLGHGVFAAQKQSYVLCMAVSVNALIYAIKAAAINAIKYFNAINAIKKKKCLVPLFG